MVSHAFRSLPPIEDFLQARQNKEFIRRQQFEKDADEAYDRFLKSRGMSSDEEQRRHLEYYKEQLLSSESRSPEATEISDLKEMLNVRGVRGVDKSVLDFLEKSMGKRESFSMSAIVTAFRGQRKTTGGEGLGRASAKKKMQKSPSKKKESAMSALSYAELVRPVLSEMGFGSEVIDNAVTAHGTDVPAAIEYCLTAADHIADEKDIITAMLLEMGFDAEAITQAVPEHALSRCSCW